MTGAEDTQREEKTIASTSASKTKVHFSKSAVYKYLSGRREPISIRIDTGLYSAFKPLSKRVYGSTCKAIEIYMIALIEAVEKGVHFSDTVRPIQIEKIVIERNFSRRKMIYETETEIKETFVKCAFKDCRNQAVSKAVLRDGSREYAVCQRHLSACQKDRLNWRIP